LGKTLATAPSRDGNDVLIVDVNKGSLDNLGREFHGSCLEGDEAGLAALQSGNCEGDLTHRSNAARCSQPVGDAAAKTLVQVPRVMARLNDPQRNEIVRQLAIETVSPASVAAELFRRRLKDGNGGPYP
jgi:trk system potassium uptake protein TrkA